MIQHGYATPGLHLAIFAINIYNKLNGVKYMLYLATVKSWADLSK